jgi:hypothetical protein
MRPTPAPQSEGNRAYALIDIRQRSLGTDRVSANQTCLLRRV